MFEKLNTKVKGSKTSAHLKANALDLYPTNGKFSEFVTFVKKYLRDKKFDQAIIEKNGSGSQWVHIGLYNNEGEQRRHIFKMNVA